MMTKLRIWGGAGEHGRSCYVFEGKQHRVMLDCGVKKEGTGQYPVFPPQEAERLTAVLLSHAHEDHSMAIPLLYKNGYRGEVWTTKATAEQLGSYFRSWHTYVESRGGKLPYDERDIESIAYRYLEDEAPSGVWQEACPGVRIMWGRSGHLAGAVWYMVEIEGKRLFFSGDYSRESELLAADAPGLAVRGGVHDLPEWMMEPELADISIMDNAYGMDIDPQPVKLERLRAGMEQILSSGGHVLLPVPAFGRGQDLIVWASEQFPEQAMIVEPDIWQGLQRLSRLKEWLRPEAPVRIEHVLHSGRIFVPRDAAERVRLLEQNAAAVIVTGDGMMDSPRARWYYQYLSDHPPSAGDGEGSGKSNHNGVILTGHASSGSFGKHLLDCTNQKTGQKTDQNDCCIVRHLIYKVHQGVSDVRQMLKELPGKQVVLVHAPKPQTDLVRDELIREGWTEHESSVKAIHSLEPGAALNV
ncbi:metal-dependent RNase, consists of a metallo-beta-lactamase domain and an RNA-binding KH domain [Paenibacillus terrae HPL-003]|uniref:Metal-dependent RNase, consists of a metallo-beta-lactamase domain and an RNA-binding KH domain n=2 Tax=Paenibacillus terrae TaxID=159743 RepID=G7VX12_PAETH|nr:metal-dependent RNase, consists of a metallo-beta-lactamase domain and an RNA-binding KH domain [Paenibacillus terrae HPL-003]